MLCLKSATKLIEEPSTFQVLNTRRDGRRYKMATSWEPAVDRTTTDDTLEAAGPFVPLSKRRTISPFD